MAPAVPEWTRQWHKFLVERIGIDSLQLGLLLLMLLSLLTLLLSIMSVSLRFCCCPKRSAGRCRRRKPTGAMPSRTTTNSFTGTNEERRCLLQPNGICAVAVSNRAPQQAQQQLEKKAEPNVEVDQQSRGQQQAVTEPTVGAAPPQPPAQFEKSAIVADSVKASLCQIPLALTPRGNLPPSRPAHFSAESPPPPRRFASSGGRTQVLPLTSQNRRRVPPLVMLMAEQQQQQLHQRQQMMARGRMPTTPDSRATTTTTTGGMKSCATILEDPEEMNHRPLADELLSIDRTFVSADDEQQQQEEELNRFVHRLPLHQPPPTFEVRKQQRHKNVPNKNVQPPTYSPPEPPSKMMSKNFWCESNNLSSSDRSSYGAQTSLNTTTGSSADESITTSSIVVVVVNRRNVVEEEEVRISELESETGASPAPPPPPPPPPTFSSSSNGVGWCHAGPAFAANGAALPPGHAAIVQHHRVPRSISQQLELMNMTTQS